MIFVSLLRGINVGGKNKVEMGRLAAKFTAAGCSAVTTYINSGNVIFSDDRDRADLIPVLEQAILEEFGFPVKALLRDIDGIRAVVAAVPGHWVNDPSERTDVWFLWEDFDTPEVMDDFTIKEGIDEAFYMPGAVVWRADGAQLTRSGRTKVTTLPVYKHITIRNINTVRKIHALMEELG